MTAKVFVDTNILVYAYDRDAGKRHAAAKELVRALWTERSGLVSTQVLQEFYVITTRKLKRPLTASQAREVIRTYEPWVRSAIQTRTLLRASEVAENRTISFWDALILACAEQDGAEELLTEDLQHSASISGIRIRNPFVAAE